MLVNIWVKDNCTGYVHQVGTDPHDSLECWNGVVQYVNLQCMEGTMGGGYSFVEPPDLDDYVSVTPEQLMINREMLHADLAAMIAANPELMPHAETVPRSCTDTRLRMANTENDELKRLLRLAVEDFETAMLEEKCKVCGLEHCDYDEICKWRHHDEAMELLGGTENAEN